MEASAAGMSDICTTVGQGSFVFAVMARTCAARGSKCVRCYLTLISYVGR